MQCLLSVAAVSLPLPFQGSISSVSLSDQQWCYWPIWVPSRRVPLWMIIQHWAWWCGFRDLRCGCWCSPVSGPGVWAGSWGRKTLSGDPRGDRLLLSGDPLVHASLASPDGTVLGNAWHGFGGLRSIFLAGWSIGIFTRRQSWYRSTPQNALIWQSVTLSVPTLVWFLVKVFLDYHFYLIVGVDWPLSVVLGFAGSMFGSPPISPCTIHSI